MPSQPRFDIISIGDASMDVFAQLHDASLVCTTDTPNCLLCLNFADKIPVESLAFTIGGNACNNAVGSSRLGLKTALYSVIGDDYTGAQIRAHLKKEGVSPQYVKIVKGKPSNFSIVLNHKAERTILVYHEPRTYVLPNLHSARWVYLTSLGTNFNAIHRQVYRQLKNNGALLAFNPGTHQLRAGAEALKPILKITKVLIVNKEEAQTLLASEESETKSLIGKLHALGPEIVVVTDGPRGAHGSDGRKVYRAKPLKAHPLEMTGAGDSFSTGFLAALAYGKTISDALLWGSANAASVIEHVGPQAGLLTKSKLITRIRKSR